LPSSATTAAGSFERLQLDLDLGEFFAELLILDHRLAAGLNLGGHSLMRRMRSLRR
jgi:hypothetical protein